MISVTKRLFRFDWLDARSCLPALSEARRSRLFPILRNEIERHAMSPYVTSPGLYLSLLLTHQIAVSLSVALFVARGVGVQCAANWPMHFVVSKLSVLIDVILLSAGASLWVLLQYNPVLHMWLGVKLLLLVLYIVLGSFALRRGRTPASRAVFFVAALACVFWMVGIALARHPMSWVLLWA